MNQAKDIEALYSLNMKYEYSGFLKSYQNMLQEYLVAIKSQGISYGEETKSGKPPFEIWSCTGRISLFPDKKFEDSGKSKTEMKENICRQIIEKIIKSQPKNNQYSNENHNGAFHLIIEELGSFSFLSIMIKKSKEVDQKIGIIGNDIQNIAVRFPEYFEKSTEGDILACFEYKHPLSPEWIMKIKLQHVIFLVIDKDHVTNAIIKCADYINGIKV